MDYREINGDLFSDFQKYDWSAECCYAQCISADFACGKGIALKFNEFFDVKNNLQKAYPDFVNLYHQHKYNGTCIFHNRVFNLITKERYFEKPTYDSIENAIKQMRCLAEQLEVRKIKMPRIGCGLDRLSWDRVSEIIKSAFDNSEMAIEVYYL